MLLAGSDGLATRILYMGRKQSDTDIIGRYLLQFFHAY